MMSFPMWKLRTIDLALNILIRRDGWSWKKMHFEGVNSIPFAIIPTFHVHCHIRLSASIRYFTPVILPDHTERSRGVSHRRPIV